MVFSTNIHRTLACGVVLMVLTACTTTANKVTSEKPVQPELVITMDATYLALAKTRLAAGDAKLKPAYDKLIQDANVVLAMPPESVTYKKLVPPSGTKNDYMSLAPYWWPNPSKPDGLPFIQKDGQTNPSAKNGDTDSQRMQFMCLSAQTLSLAYYFSGDRQFAKKTADVVRTWFLNPATRMNPNLRYGQAIRGIVDGRGIGIIDTRNLRMVVDAALLIKDTGELTVQEMEALRQWFKEFTHWMLTSDIGIDEYNEFNNHGVFYDMQVANYALFLGDTALAKSTIKRALNLRIASQVTSQGKQWGELERTRPFHYSSFNLEAMTNIGRYAEQVGIDGWNTRKRTRGIFNAVGYMVPFVMDPGSWPYRELDGAAEIQTAVTFLLRAERAYGSGIYAAAVSKLPEVAQAIPEYGPLYIGIPTAAPTVNTVQERLMWPVK